MQVEYIQWKVVNSENIFLLEEIPVLYIPYLCKRLVFIFTVTTETEYIIVIIFQQSLNKHIILS